MLDLAVQLRGGWLLPTGQEMTCDRRWLDFVPGLNLDLRIPKDPRRNIALRFDLQNRADISPLAEEGGQC